MKKSKFSAFLCGALSASVLFACVGGALAASGAISFNTADFSINNHTILKKGENIQTEAGASIPSSILYTDELGGGTYYIPVRELAETFHMPLEWDVDRGVSLRVSDDLGLYLLSTGSSGYTVNNTLQAIEPITPTDGTVILSTEHDSTENFETELDLKPGKGRYVSITVTNHRDDVPVQFGVGLVERDSLPSVNLTQVPAGETITRTIKIIPPEDETMYAPYISVGNPGEVCRRNWVTITAVQFDGP